MFNKIKAIKNLRDQAKKMQNALSDIVEIGEGGHGHVRVAIDGNQKVTRVEVDDDVRGDKAKLEAAFMDACNNAMEKVHKRMAAKMKEMGGLDALKNLGI